MLSVDPGVKHCGFALWDDGELQRAWLHECVDGHVGTVHVEVPGVVLDEIVIERPQVYSSCFLRGDPNDLVSIALVGGEIAGRAKALWGERIGVTYYYPKTWKGQIDKAAHQPRIITALSEAERSLIELPRAKALHHNIYDSVGIGLFKLGRLGRGVVKKAKRA